ncbi:MAG: UDP-N-acetylglucosamine--N-acetylmuramyl-(pentapeptide) pyrophosphoryl-undecaprenol N-acetylglucosamine transferase [Tepidisphaeraceae bacterium]|jgi:UDP-N-acetylglucosamine--N-acetylmuramyl-(pentapeptide) pyrophosphoryl-undecaprenol N-acetylglucosamine transferase
MSDVPLIIMAGGGTGGHLYPGVAVAQALRLSSGPVDILFLCTGREIDRVILEPTGFEFIPQPIERLAHSVSGLLRFWKGWRETKDLVAKTLKQRKPAAVVGLGGYAAGVAVKLAAERGIPTAILNPDAIPGKANQYLMRYAMAVCCQFDVTAQHVSAENRGKLITTGCPIRPDILQLPPREEAAARLMIEPNLQTLMITGASQGAKTVNEAALELFKTITLRGWQVLHLSGREHAESVRAGYRELGLAARVVDFTPAMADVWAVSDLAISRSGASSCAELTACGVPSILMPYPFHKDMHQRANAKVLAHAGAAIWAEDLRDRRKNAETLKPIVESLLYDLPKRQTMADAARKLGRPDAARAVASKITQIIASGR